MKKQNIYRTKKANKGFTSRLAMQSQAQRGFTLIELMVVIAIIAVLVTIVVVAINPVKLINDAQDARRRSDLQAIRTSLQLYYNDNRDYPAALATLVPTYIKQIPTDPSGSAYGYQAFNSNADYIAGAVLRGTGNNDDGNTLTKCEVVSPADNPINTPDGTAETEVCND